MNQYTNLKYAYEFNNVLPHKGTSILVVDGAGSVLMERTTLCNLLSEEGVKGTKITVYIDENDCVIMLATPDKLTILGVKRPTLAQLLPC